MQHNLSTKNKSIVVNLDIKRNIYRISDLPENEIWNEFKNGNEGAFNYIYETYFQILYQYGQQFTKDLDLIKDLIQDLLIYIRKNRKNLGNTQSIKFYLFKAFRRKIFKYQKFNKLIYSNHIESFGNFVIEDSFEISLVQNQYWNRVKRILEKAFLNLSKRQKEAIYLYFYQSMGYEEVASIMGLKNVKSARNLIYKSIDVLKNQIDPIKNSLFITL